MCHGDLLLEGEKPNKQPHMCESYFEDSFLQYKVSFFDSLLPEWSEIETKTRVLFKRFRDSALEKSLDKTIISVDRISPYLFSKDQVQP